MKTKHIANIGFPRCGTTWLWHQLVQHPEIGPANYPKEDQIFLSKQNFLEYSRVYQDHDISLNFDVELWSVDQELIKFVNSYATHISLILRDPYDFLERWHAWLDVNISNEEFIDQWIESKMICYADIVQRWFNIVGTEKFKVFLFEDLQKNPKQFLLDYFEFCGVDCVDIDNCEIPQNQNPIKTHLAFTKKQQQIINSEILKFQSVINKDLSHWFRTA